MSKKIKTTSIQMVMLLLLSCVHTKTIVNEEGQKIRDSIASLDTIEIGGQKQFILIRGNSVKNPVLLFLHGGPGSPETGLVRKYHQSLEKHFTIALWEQRGAGKSFPFTESKETMTLEQFVQDTHEVTQYLKVRFQQNKIFIIGHSWGSYLALKVASNYPEDYHAVVSAGLLVNTVKNEEISYSWALRKAQENKNDDIVNVLEEIGPPVNGYYKSGKEGLFKEREIVMELGGATYKKFNKMKILNDIIFPDEYNLIDSVRYIRGINFSMDAFFPIYHQVNLSKEVPEIKIPLFIFTGRYDYQTPAEIALEYFNNVRAPKKKWVWFEQSAHSQIYEESEKYIDLMVNEVRNNYKAEK